MTRADSLMVSKALHLATVFMWGQFDRVGKPLILHSLRVGVMGKTAEEMTVGFMHDLIEDTTCTLDYLVAIEFPERIVLAVQTLTHVKPGPIYREYIRAIKSNTLATVVKLNDLSDNIARIHELPLETERVGLFDRWTWASLFLQSKCE